MIPLSKRLNKRGQELSITTLVLIALGVVILVLLVLGFTKGWDWVTSKFDILPGQSLETVAQSCAIAAQGELKIDFCSYKKIKVDGQREYVNCQDARLQGSIDSDINTDGWCNVKATNYCTKTLKGSVTDCTKPNLGVVNGINCCKIVAETPAAP